MKGSGPVGVANSARSPADGEAIAPARALQTLNAPVEAIPLASQMAAG